MQLPETPTLSKEAPIQSPEILTGSQAIKTGLPVIQMV